MSQRRLTRREFLEETARRSAGATAAAVVFPTLPSDEPPGDRTDLPTGTPDRALRELVDEIIPAGDGMPAASAAGVVEYLRQLSARQADVSQTLSRLQEVADAVAGERFGQGLAALTGEERIQVLQEIETEREPELFGGFVALVYEAYYVQPIVWERLGYEPYPTGEPGPEMAAFDPARLDRVRALGPLYLDVP